MGDPLRLELTRSTQNNAVGSGEPDRYVLRYDFRLHVLAGGYNLRWKSHGRIVSWIREYNLVDFKKRLSGKSAVRPASPLDIYERLDRASDKGPLRPAQEVVLQTWFDEYQDQRDTVIKLHTGQGKTLIGLLMLQSQLNRGGGPVVYLCPDNYLIKQTCSQAKQFGIKTCTTDGDIPDAFMNSSAILVTSVQKMFNGLTKFGLNNKSLDVGSVLGSGLITRI